MTISSGNRGVPMTTNERINALEDRLASLEARLDRIVDQVEGRDGRPEITIGYIRLGDVRIGDVIEMNSARVSGTTRTGAASWRPVCCIDRGDVTTRVWDAEDGQRLARSGHHYRLTLSGFNEALVRIQRETLT